MAVTCAQAATLRKDGGAAMAGRAGLERAIVPKLRHEAGRATLL